MSNQEQKNIQQELVPEQPEDNRIEGSEKEGLFGAVASTVMGAVSLIVSLAVSMNVIGEMLCLYGLILGCRAIRDAKTATLWQKKEPKATLVYGIIGVVLNSIAIIVWILWIAGYFILLYYGA